MNKQTYRVAKGVIRRPRNGSKRAFSTAGDFIGQGEILPDGMLSASEAQSLLASGIIEVVATVPGQAPARASARRGPWSVDPASLVGKSLEDLLVMILEIDEKYDVTEVTSEQAAVVQLTADWDPSFREAIARSTDRSRPEQLAMSSTKRADGKVLAVHGVKEGGDKPMSDAAQKALERARAKAQAKPVEPEVLQTTDLVDLDKQQS